MKQSPSTRWKFLDPSLPEEAAHQRSLLTKIEDWWTAFAGRTQRLDDLFKQKNQWDLPAWMGRHLQAIHPRLMWEYGPALRGKGHRLVITPESARQLRPLTDAIIERAPRLKGWEFYPYRP